MSENTSGGSGASAGTGSHGPGQVNIGNRTGAGDRGTSGTTRRSGRSGRARTEYQTVNVGGRQVRVAKTLSERTNARRGYCNSCSGNGCAECAGRGRATDGSTARTARTARASRPAAARTAKRSKAKRPRRAGLLGLLGFRKRTPLRRRAKNWLRNTFGTQTTARRAGAGAGRGGQVVAIGGNPGASWWRCPRCGATEYALPDADVATGRAARHVAEVHPGMPFRIDPQ